MPTRLDEHLVADSLSALDDWSGDTSKITRSVTLPNDVLDRLLAEVQTTADSMNHHPVVQREGDAVRFELWTHSLEGVSELDIVLASRIDDLVLRLTGRTRELPPEVTSPVAFADDVAVEQEKAKVAEENARAETALSGVDQLEPMVGVPSTTGGATPTPGVALPDTAPGEPEPGPATPAGQGSPPGVGSAPEPPAGEPSPAGTPPAAAGSPPDRGPVGDGPRDTPG